MSQCANVQIARGGKEGKTKFFPLLIYILSWFIPLAEQLGLFSGLKGKPTEGGSDH